MPVTNHQARTATSTDAAVVALHDVGYAYPKTREGRVLDRIDLAVHPGRYLLISGASGSGKSTLVRALNGLIPHFYGGRLTGEIRIAGRSVHQCSVADCFDQVGLVAQNPRAQLFNRTVTQELAFGLESLGWPRETMQERIHAVAREMGIDALLARNPQTLSGGEQQLVAIAAVLTARPRIVVLDEPLANLDPAHVGRLRGILSQMLARGRGVVVCEHRMVPTLPDAHEVAVLDNGHLLIHGPVADCLGDPRWQTSRVDLPLAVQVGRDLKQNPLPRTVAAVSCTQARAWLDTQPPYPPAVPSSQGNPVLEAQDIHWEVDARPILNGIDMALYPGRCAAIVGANGAGKTSLLRIINGLVRPTRGTIRIMGRAVRGQPAWQVARHVGTAFQNPDSQFFKLSVAEELAVGPQAQGCHDARWIAQLTDWFHLGHLVNRSPFKLSGGEKKRVAFASALAARPDILVLDEPTAGQDSGFALALADCIEQLCQRGTAVLIVTHALNFAEAVAPHWMVMARGRIIGRGTPQAVMADEEMMAKAGLEPTERFHLWQKAQQD